MAKRAKKTNTEAFSLIPRRTIRSKELNELSVHARWLYVVLTTEWRRGEEQNKHFIFTYKQLQDITRFRPIRIKNALDQLEAAQFIYINHGGRNNPHRFTTNLDWLNLKKNSGPYGK